MTGWSMQDRLSQALRGEGGALAAANRLCSACVDVLEIDGAAISMLHNGASRGTFGSSGALSRQLDEFQFTFGEGPCIDAVRLGTPVLAADLQDPQEQRWPAFAGALLDRGIRAVFALPVAVENQRIAALDLFRHEQGALSKQALRGGLHAAELAGGPLLELMTSTSLDWDQVAEGADSGGQLDSLERVEVYQATGMIMDSWDLTADDALMRLRAHAFKLGVTASELAWEVVERRIRLAPGQEWSSPPGGASS